MFPPGLKSALRILRKELAAFWRSILIVMVPIIFLFLPLSVGPKNGLEKEMSCLYIVCVMAVYWTAEVVPLAVTAFIPIFLMPLMGVNGVKVTAQQYLKDTNFLFFGGLIMAVAVEEANLHKRIALKVLVMVGSKPRWLMMGFMGTTAFLSMWMSNTATTAMMVPIAVAVLEEIIYAKEANNHPSSVNLQPIVGNGQSSNGEISTISMTSASGVGLVASHTEHNHPRVEHENLRDRFHDVPEGVSVINSNLLSKKDKSMCKGILLCICYAANIGGTGTLTGTGPNIVLRGTLDSQYPKADTGITFASWLPLGIVTVVLSLVLGWLWLQIAFLGLRKPWEICIRSTENAEAEAKVNALLRQQYTDLGKMTTITDACAAMAIGTVLFMWPNKMPDFYCFRQDKEQPIERREGLMTWKAMKNRFPWSVIMLLGGGFALAKGSSGLSKLIGHSMGNAMSGLGNGGISAVFTVLITFVTEVSSNTATASIFIPVLCSLAGSLCVNPLYFVIPATLACSFAFMLPVSTPPNAIVYEAGAVRIIDMMGAGFVMNCVCICVSLLTTNTVALALFDLNTFPNWTHADPETNLTRCLLTNIK